jgi:hypothetical protein
MAIGPLRPHASWYRRFWYEERSPLETLVDRVLIFGILILLVLAGATRHAQHDAAPKAPGGVTLSGAGR